MSVSYSSFSAAEIVRALMLLTYAYYSIYMLKSTSVVLISHFPETASTPRVHALGPTAHFNEGALRAPDPA
jgi:hypothetical protein